MGSLARAERFALKGRAGRVAGRGHFSGENGSMSTPSIKNGFVVPAVPRDCREAGGDRASDGGAAHREPPLLEMLSLGGWRKLVLETFVFLAVITVIQRWLFGVTEIPGLPHPYWLPVLLASCQYGVSGGMIAAVFAFFGLLVWAFATISRAGFLRLCRDDRRPASRLAGDGARCRWAAQFAYSSIHGAGRPARSQSPTCERPQRWPRASHSRDQCA